MHALSSIPMLPGIVQEAILGRICSNVQHMSQNGDLGNVECAQETL